MLRYECRFFEKKFPDEGEMVVGRVALVDDEGVSVDLLEYGYARGLVLVGELSKKRIKSVQQIAKVGNIEICNVLRVDQNKGYIDLSMARVTEKEKSECKENYTKNKLAYHIMSRAAKMLQMSVPDLYKNFGWEKTSEFGSLYYFFARVKENESILENSEIGTVIKKIIKERFQSSTYKVRADIDVSCAYKGGVESIKEAFLEAMKLDSKLMINLIKTPTYSITRISSNKEKAFGIVKSACEVISRNIIARGGYSHVVEQPKLYGEKGRHLVLNFEADDEEDQSEISD